MTEAPLHDLWTPDKLSARILLDGCRYALSCGHFENWVRLRRQDIGKVLVVARALDPELHAELQQRPEVRRPLLVQTTQAWRREDTSSLPLAVELAMFGGDGQVSLQFSQLFDEMVDPLSDGARAAAYRDLVERLRPFILNTDAADAEVQQGGWIYLLVDAGKAALQDQQPTLAVALLEEAWQYRHYLPADTLETARALAHLATTYAAAIGWLPTVDPDTDPFVEVLARLTAARAELDGHPGTPGAVQSRIGLAISESQAWYMRRRIGSIGFITEATARVAVLTVAEGEVWQRLTAVDPAIAKYDYQALPNELRAPLARLLADLGSAAHTAGQSSLAERAARDAVALSDRPHHRIDAQLTLARLQNSLDDRLRHNHVLLRDIESGQLGGLSPWQHKRIRRRLRHEWDDVSRVLFREKMPIAALFWQHQSRSWTDPTSANQDVVAKHPRQRNIATAQSQTWRDRTVEAVRRENVYAVILQLKFAAEQEHPVAELLAGLAEVDAWRPPGRRLDPERPIPDVETSWTELRMAALHLATEFVDVYADHLGAQIYLRMAQEPTLSWDRRSQWARKALTSSERTGRSAYAVGAWIELLRLALQRGITAMVIECVREIQRVINRVLASAIGAADLLDRADEMIRKSARAAALLAEHRHSRPAYELASVATGALRRMIATDPSVAEELELAEQRAETRDEEIDEQLFRLMRDRVLASSHALAQIDLDTDSRPPVPFSLVQLLDAGDLGCWALGRTGTRYWTERLLVDSHGLQELRATVWHQLRPTRRRAPVLTDLHRVAVAPLVPHIGSGDVMFVLHRGFAGLPLHAAYDGTRFLIERHRVSYLPSPDPQRSTGVVRPDALVAGWDPAIDASAEASEIADRLKALGLRVTRPASAADGRRALLDSRIEFGMVHLAAHGDFHAWPRSMRSQLRLSRRVSITAGEWLRSSCRATFVFLNACNVGRHAPHAGDLNGFPLAVQVRGGMAGVAALAPVPSGQARAFAQRFYTSWPLSDSLSAFREGCVGAIAAGESVSGWAPYLHTGLPIRLS